MSAAYSIRGDKRSDRAFALVLVVVLLALLVLLLVGLATLARVEGRVAENRRAYADARRHAFVGLERALGDLQRQAGPDRCATARAAFLEGVDANRSHWTGVWRAGEVAPVWLVSSPPDLAPDPRATAWRSPVTLVGPATVEVTGPPADDPDVIRVESVPLTVPRAGYPGWLAAEDPAIGRFAYWVGDESAKVAVAVADDRLETTGFDGSARWPRTEPGLFWGGLDPHDPALDGALSKALVYSQLGYVDPAFSPTWLRRNHPRTTLRSLGVIADATDGGLRTAAVLDGANPYEPGGLPRYDRVFLPSAPAAEATLPRALPAARFALRRRGDVTPSAAMVAEAGVAANGWAAGTFNLNSADPDPFGQRQTWRAVLGAARQLTLPDGAVRDLTDSEREALATQLTLARFRGGYAGAGKAEGEPFRSLSSFAASGLLDAALAATPINDGFLPGDNGHVSGAHLLAVLAPILTVRGDTFTIRAYGEARNPVTGATLAEAWCEAEVQRLPDYVDAGDAPESAPTRPDNLTYGRRFIVTSFRWLTPADL